jgi:hypothetical protein
VSDRAIGYWFTIVLTLVLIAGIQVWASFRCDRLAEFSNITTKFDVFSGCYIKVGNRFLPEARWREVILEER